MRLRDQLESLRDKSIVNLKDAHDYYTYTKDAWRTLQQDVQRAGRKLSWRNLSTNSSVNEQDLLARAQRYVQVELTSSTLQQFVSIFENFLSDSIRTWLLAYPERLSKRQLSGKEIFSLADKAAIIDTLVEKELREVFYDRPANWFEYIKAMVNVTAPTLTESELFAEVKATRDVLVHGQGIANAYYLDKSGRHARGSSGQLLDIPEPYYQKSWDLICKLVGDIGTEMAAKA